MQGWQKLARAPRNDQAQQAFINVETALAAHGLGLSDVVQLRTCVVAPDFERLGQIAQVIRAGYGDQPPPQTVIGVAALAMPDILFQVEAIAARS